MSPAAAAAEAQPATKQTQVPSHTPIYIQRARAGARGLLFASLSLLLSACGSSGGSSGSAPSAPDLAPPTQSPATKTLVLKHGLGFLCTTFGSSPEYVYCWASEPTAITNGDAPEVGLISTTPQLMLAAPGTTTLVIDDHGLCVAGNCAGNLASGTASVYEETVVCTVTSATSLHCPGEATADLDFAGGPSFVVSSAALPADIRVRHYPHSPTWRHIQKTVGLRAAAAGKRA